jgi:DNA-binding response OmpR family regulator
MNILVVEDTDAIATMIEALVSARGFSVVRAETGPKALEAAATQGFDLVLLDVNLPGGLDGYAVCERLRADARTKEIPIVFITAMSDDEHQRRAFDLGATAFYAKPFSPTALLKEIEALRQRSGAHRTL